MAKRTLSKEARFERLFKVWEYLRKNTDSQHPTSQAKMREDEEIKEYIGGKQAFNRLIKDMANAMNTDEHGVYKKEDEWKIYFNDLKKYYGDEAEPENATDENGEEVPMRLTGLYYNRTFSYEEINCLIEGIYATKTLDTKSAEKLVQKVKDTLTTKFYKAYPRKICKIQEPELTNREQLRENLLILQEAIDNGVEVSFRFNGYSHKKELVPLRDWKDTVSPYYIVANGGRYYLLACRDTIFEGKPVKRMSIWRVDLMTELEIPDKGKLEGYPGNPRIPKREVENLPDHWNEDFQLKHLNMSYDKPIPITLRVKCERDKKDPTKRLDPGYTFLHDWFGNNFTYIRTEKESPYDDIVRVECSPFGMVNWALQYSDRVEVVEPKEVRDEVVEKVKKLNEKYGVVLEGKKREEGK